MFENFHEIFLIQGVTYTLHILDIDLTTKPTTTIINLVTRSHNFTGA